MSRTSSRPIHAFPVIDSIAMRVLALAAVTALTACGGGSTTSDATGRSTEAKVKVAASTTVAQTGDDTTVPETDTSSTASQAPVSTLVISAYSNLLDGTGAIMQVSVDGDVIGTQQVDAVAPQDYVFRTTHSLSGAAIALTFTNDAVSATEDRNLWVRSVTVAGEPIPATRGFVVVDDGAGAAGDTQSVVWTNGSLRLWGPVIQPFAAGTAVGDGAHTLVIRAHADLYAGIGAIMKVSVGGEAIGTLRVDATQDTDYVFRTDRTLALAPIDVAFTNDMSTGTMDRNLIVQSVTVDGEPVPATTGFVIMDDGIGAVGSDDSILWSNGALHLWGPAADVAAASSAGTGANALVVKAHADLYANRGAVMVVDVDGVEIGRLRVDATTDADYTFRTDASLSGAKVDIAFANDMSANGMDRNLYVTSVSTDGQTLAATTGTVDVGIGTALADSVLLWSDGALHLTLGSDAAATVQ